MTEPTSWLRGAWMQTYTGRQFFPLDANPEDVDPVDIAHALSMICRYGGHAARFYSVAEHSVLLSHAVAPEYALWALLHDAAEAYVGDMVRPLKQQLPAYQQIEDDLLSVIALRFGLPIGTSGFLIPQPVKDADNRILLDERAMVLSEPPTAWVQDLDDTKPLGVDVHCWEPARAEFEFICRLKDLTDLDSWQWLGSSR